MLSVIDGSTTALLGLALDAAAMRQQAIAQNIANVNTRGYQRVGVSFEARMAALVDGQGQVRAPAPAEMAGLRPYLRLQNDGAPVALDTEMAQLSENTLHQQVLLKALQRHLGLLGLAINEGKR